MLHWRHTLIFHLVGAALVVALSGCASNAPTAGAEPTGGRTVCDSYIILSMCVEDVIGDNTVDIIYFTDSNEVFMYQEGRRQVVPEHMAFHRCAVPLAEGMQATTNRILNRDNLSLTEELDITRLLIANYVAAKPVIDACNEEFEDDAVGDTVSEDDFSDYEEVWEVDEATRVGDGSLL